MDQIVNLVIFQWLVYYLFIVISIIHKHLKLTLPTVWYSIVPLHQMHGFQEQKWCHFGFYLLDHRWVVCSRWEIFSILFHFIIDVSCSTNASVVTFLILLMLSCLWSQWSICPSLWLSNAHILNLINLFKACFFFSC